MDLTVLIEQVDGSFWQEIFLTIENQNFVDSENEIPEEARQIFDMNTMEMALSSLVRKYRKTKVTSVALQSLIAYNIHEPPFSKEVSEEELNECADIAQQAINLSDIYKDLFLFSVNKRLGDQLNDDEKFAFCAGFKIAIEKA